MRAFSRRRADIEAALAEQGTSSARAAEAAALATRQSKDKRTGIDALAREWRTRGEALSFGRPEVARSLGHASDAGPARLTSSASSTPWLLRLG